MRKGQVAIEFMAMMGFSMFLLAILFGFVAAKEAEAFRYQNHQTASDIAENVAFQVEMALVQGDGYSRTFILPQAIGGENYTLTVTNSTVHIAWADQFSTEPTLYTGKRIELKSEASREFVVKNNGSVYLFPK